MWNLLYLFGRYLWTTTLTSKKSHRQRDGPAPRPRAPPDPRDRRPGGPRHLLVHHGRRRGRVQHQVPQLCRWDVTRDIEKLLTRYICQISRRVLRCVSVTMPMTTRPTSTRPSVSWTSASAYSMPVLTEGKEWHLVTPWTYVHFSDCPLRPSAALKTTVAPQSHAITTAIAILIRLVEMRALKRCKLPTKLHEVM